MSEIIAARRGLQTASLSLLTALSTQGLIVSVIAIGAMLFL